MTSTEIEAPGRRQAARQRLGALAAPGRRWRVGLVLVLLVALLAGGLLWAGGRSGPETGLTGEPVPRGRLVFFSMVDLDTGPVLREVAYGETTPDAVLIDNFGSALPVIVPGTKETRIYAQGAVMFRTFGEWAIPELGSDTWIREDVAPEIAGPRPGPSTFRELARQVPAKWEAVFGEMTDRGERFVPLQGSRANDWAVDVSFETARLFTMATVPPFIAPVDDAKALAQDDQKNIDEAKLDKVKFTLHAYKRGDEIIAAAISVDPRALDPNAHVVTVGVYAVPGDAEIVIPQNTISATEFHAMRNQVQPAR